MLGPVDDLPLKRKFRCEICNTEEFTYETAEPLCKKCFKYSNTCQFHPQIADMVCLECKVIVCKICHKGHESRPIGVVLPNLVDSFLSNQLNAAVTVLESIKIKMDKVVEWKSELEMQHQKYMDELKRERDKAKEKLESQFSDSKFLLDSSFDVTNNDLYRMKWQLEENLALLDSTLQDAIRCIESSTLTEKTQILLRSEKVIQNCIQVDSNTFKDPLNDRVCGYPNLIKQDRDIDNYLCGWKLKPDKMKISHPKMDGADNLIMILNEFEMVDIMGVQSRPTLQADQKINISIKATSHGISYQREILQELTLTDGKYLIVIDGKQVSNRRRFESHPSNYSTEVEIIIRSVSLDAGILLEDIFLVKGMNVY
jgi:hypothetical protein